MYLQVADHIANAEFVHEEPTKEEINRILQEGNQSFETMTQNGEYKMIPEEIPGRYEYVDKINVKSNDTEKIAFAKQLLLDTETFWSKHNFDLGKFDREARITLNNTQPIRDKYRPVNPQKEKKSTRNHRPIRKKHELISIL